ncbi:hypothetical protein Goari_017336 [Gossypium aridum]|uniref:Uncharacterized protein n=1 Tax=Gossypium aridum TaxID=34290 RepID=A0A7J8WL92_GOSAI|nr:hypothetical protein [Gossypium aridum]
MINKAHVLTYFYLLIYILLSSGVILYNKVTHFIVFHFRFRFGLQQKKAMIFLFHFDKAIMQFILSFNFAVGSVSQILQFSFSYNVDNDSHGILRNRCIFSYPCFQGTSDMQLYSIASYCKECLHAKLVNAKQHIPISLLYANSSRNANFEVKFPLLNVTMQVVAPVKMTFEIYATCVVPISAFFASSLWFGNTAYLHISVAFIQMLKALSMWKQIALFSYIE